MVRKETKVEDKNIYFWENGCPFCKKVWLALEIDEINKKLPKERRIIPVKIKEFNQTNDLVKRHNANATPTLIIDGIRYVGATSVGYFKGIFEKHFEDDIIPWLQ